MRPESRGIGENVGPGISRCALAKTDLLKIVVNKVQCERFVEFALDHSPDATSCTGIKQPSITYEHSEQAKVLAHGPVMCYVRAFQAKVSLPTPVMSVNLCASRVINLGGLWLFNC
jgi:hypothetical protein